jgi:hypothetical protein
MRWPAAALLLFSAIGTASAEIRIDESRYEDGKTVIAGETGPGRTITLDDKYTAKSDGEGHFKFAVKYKPPTCVSDIKAGEDIYSAVIAGCFGATTDGSAAMKPAKPRPQESGNQPRLLH